MYLNFIKVTQRLIFLTTLLFSWPRLYVLEGRSRSIKYWLAEKHESRTKSLSLLLTSVAAELGGASGSSIEGDAEGS